MKKKIEWLYEEFHFLFWYFVGLIPAALFYLGQPAPTHLIEKFGSFKSTALLGIYTIFVAAPIAISIWIITMFMGFCAHLVFRGIREKEFHYFAAAIWIALGMLMFISDSFAYLRK